MRWYLPIPDGVAKQPVYAACVWIYAPHEVEKVVAVPVRCTHPGLNYCGYKECMMRLWVQTRLGQRYAASNES